ncbi:MAG: pseudouridine synthase [Bacteroidetes bacterium]|nr:pseudouridine synthase [Bacteroidota bacterium]
MRSELFQYVLFYKPFGVLSQFTKELESDITLSSFGPFPKNVYPVGRLDKDSEGLLLITNDNKLKHFLTNPKYEKPKTYLVQVEGVLSKTEVEKLNSGVIIEGSKTKKAKVVVLKKAPLVPERIPPIRFRKNIPTTWLQVILCEGRNRQIRKMTARVGHPTLRIIRTSIGNIFIGNMKPGESRIISKNNII